MLKGALEEGIRLKSGPVFQSRSASGAREYRSSPDFTLTFTDGILGEAIVGEAIAIIDELFLNDHATSPTVTINIRIKVTEGHETILNESGKHTIPGGHRLGISN